MNIIDQFSNMTLMKLDQKGLNGSLKQFDVIIKTISAENEKIEEFFKKIIKFKENVISYNQGLVRSLQIYQSMFKLNQKEYIFKHLRKLKINEFGEIKLSESSEMKDLQLQIKQVSQCKIISLDHVKDDLTFNPTLDIEKLQSENIV